MATELFLERSDGQPLGSFAEMQALIGKLFASAKFAWTTSGAEKLRIAKERGIELPPVIREACERLPSLLEGVARGEGYQISFGLGHEEPVTRLYVTPRGQSIELDHALAALEKFADSKFRVAGD